MSILAALAMMEVKDKFPGKLSIIGTPAEEEDGKKIGMAAAATYGEIKMWFLTQFPEIEKMGESVDKIIDAARKARADKKNAA